MIDIRDRVRNTELHAKIVSAEEAAAFIKPGMNIGVSGFTPAGYPKAVPMALAKRMEQTPFQVNIWSGASVGDELDGSLARVNGIKKRMPYQTNGALRKQVNDGTVDYCDLHLSESAQFARYGYMGGNIDIAIVEACAITEEGHIIPTTSMGNTASYVQSADVVIVEVNTSQPLELEGMHDVYIPMDPPHRLPIPIVSVGDRIGTTYIPCGMDKIKYIVPCDIKDDVRPFGDIDDDSRRMSELTIEFFKNEIKAGRMPKNLLPLQSGVGSVANAVISGFVNSDFTGLEVYTEVIQDGMFDLADAGKLRVCSGTALSPSPDCLKKFYTNVENYKKYIVLRPQEVANSPELARRIGVIAMNTAIEVDIYGNVNSTHIAGTKIMNGIGGSGDYARNGFLTVFFTTSLAKGGAISSVVPFCSHVDHTEHDVDVIVSERGVADLRGLSPKERALVIIDKVANPKYQPLLKDYFERACKECGNSQTPHILSEALSFHDRFVKTGTMEK